MAYLKSCFLPYNCIIYTFSHLAKAIRATTMGMLERLHVNRRARTNHPPTQRTLNTTKHTHAVLAPARAHENTRTHTITQSLEYVRDRCIKQTSSYEADHPARTHRTCALHKDKSFAPHSPFKNSQVTTRSLCYLVPTNLRRTNSLKFEFEIVTY
jgi:hypothetical protein